MSLSISASLGGFSTFIVFFLFITHSYRERLQLCINYFLMVNLLSFPNVVVCAGIRI